MNRLEEINRIIKLVKENNARNNVEIVSSLLALKLNLESLEKELKQTKLNFRNSQTHSKNHYKKLKEKYEKLEKDYDELFDYHALLTLKLEQLEKENQELNKQLDVFFNNLDKNTLRAFDLISYDLKFENTKLKKAIKILKQYVAISKRRNEVNGKYDISCIYSFGSYKDIIQEEYELLEEVFGDEN